jgi:hypothetical protein
MPLPGRWQPLEKKAGRRIMVLTAQSIRIQQDCISVLRISASQNLSAMGVGHGMKI